MRAHPRGFSLLELVIVVVILSIIGAIAMPRVSRAVEMSRVNSLVSDIRTLQTAADLFDAEHDLALGRVAGGGNALPAVVISRLVNRSGADGVVIKDGLYGPYLQSWPSNPINGSDVLVVTTSDIGSSSYGWRLDPTTSTFSASVVGGSEMDVGGSAATSGIVLDTDSGSVTLNGSVGKLGG